MPKPTAKKAKKKATPKKRASKRPKKKPGRRPINPDKLMAAAQSIAMGNTVGNACTAAGIGETVYAVYRRQGKEDVEAGKFNTVAAKFWTRLEMAVAQAEQFMVSQLYTAAPTDWRAAAWWLSRRNPEEWSENQKIEHTGAGGGPIETKGDSPIVVQLVMSQPIDPEKSPFTFADDEDESDET